MSILFHGNRSVSAAGELCRRGGFSLVKVTRPAQDMRFDVPTIGPATVDNLARAGGRAIAYEAARTLILDFEETIARANAKGVVVVGFTDADVSAIEERHGRATEKARSQLGTLGAAADTGRVPPPGAAP